MDQEPQVGACGNSQTATLTVDSVVQSVTRVLLRAPNPFAVQNGDQLLLLDIDFDAWNFAELRFESDELGYMQVRQAAYTSPREAIGAVLARALAQGNDAIVNTVEQLHIYLMQHFGINILNC
jgi:hypothetical protein